MTDKLDDSELNFAPFDRLVMGMALGGRVNGAAEEAVAQIERAMANIRETLRFPEQAGSPLDDVLGALIGNLAAIREAVYGTPDDLVSTTRTSSDFDWMTDQQKASVVAVALDAVRAVFPRLPKLIETGATTFPSATSGAQETASRMAVTAAVGTELERRLGYQSAR